MSLIDMEVLGWGLKAASAIGCCSQIKGHALVGSSRIRENLGRSFNESRYLIVCPSRIMTHQNQLADC